MNADLADFTAVELLALYRSGEASPVEATQAVLRRIDQQNPTLRAYSFVAAEDALRNARLSETRWHRGEPCGPLDGVPASIKDLILTRGMPTLRGSRTVDARQAWEIDAPAGARLKEAGAVILGKTTTPEFGCPPTCTKSNPSSSTGVLPTPKNASGTAKSAAVSRRQTSLPVVRSRQTNTPSAPRA